MTQSADSGQALAIATDKIYAEGDKLWPLLKCWVSESLLLQLR